MSAANGHPSRARVAVTGIGVVSPLGIGREEMWRSVSEGRSGAGLITLVDASDWPVRMACEAHGFDPSDFMDRRVARRMDRYAQFAVAAARMAVADAGLPIDSDGEGIGAGGGVNGGHGVLLGSCWTVRSPLAWQKCQACPCFPDQGPGGS